MTWEEFKRQVEAAGVTDEMKIDWIDVGSFFDDEVNVSIHNSTFKVS